MYCSNRPETRSFDAGRGARGSGRGGREASGLRPGCGCGGLRLGTCRTKRCPGGLGRALEAFGIDRILAETMTGAVLHGIGR